MTPRWDARVDTAYLGFGIIKTNSVFLYDSLEVRILDSTLPFITVLGEFKTAIPADLFGQIQDNYWIAELNSNTSPQIQPARDFWCTWRLLGSSSNTARILLNKPAAFPKRSVVISPVGSLQYMTDYVSSQIQDSVDFWGETRVCDLNWSPVELSSFSVSYQNGDAWLNWRTASETNNFGFQIERSLGTVEKVGLSLWQPIGFVNGSGTTKEEQHYSFVDENPQSVITEDRIVKYRLRQIDYDGTSELSPVRILAIPLAGTTLELHQNYPNPVSTSDPNTVISFSLPQPDQIIIDVFDMLGRKRSTLVDKQFQGGSHSIAVETNFLGPGQYMYTLTARNARLVRRFVVQ